MLFSEQFKVTRTASDNWFDPVLSLDTPLFLDPFLIYAAERGDFVGSHDEIIRFFNYMFKLIAAAAGDERSANYRKALADLRFPEVQELCLGYTATGTRGAGSGRQITRNIAEALEGAIRAGLVRLSHFEEIGILREGIGPDRISDITAAILRRRFVKYTQDVCLRHPGITTQDVRPRQRCHRGKGVNRGKGVRNLIVIWEKRCCREDVWTSHSRSPWVILEA